MSVTVTVTVTPPNPDRPIDDIDADNKDHHPDRPIDDIDVDNKDPMFPFYLLIMIPNTIGSFATAYHRNDNDYSMAVFELLFFSVFVLVDYCLVRYLAFPKNEKSSRKFWLKVTMWFLYTGNSFGFVYLFSYFLSSQMTVALYAVMFICSAVLFSVFVIGDVVDDWRCQSLDAGVSNRAYSMLEKV